MSAGDLTASADEEIDMENIDNIVTAQNVAAIWFIVLFGVCLLAPLFPRFWK